MPLSSTAINDEVNTPPEVPITFFAMEIPPSVYRDRAYYAARDACYDSNGLLPNLRAAFREASETGRAVSVRIRIE